MEYTKFCCFKKKINKVKYYCIQINYRNAVFFDRIIETKEKFHGG